MSRFALPAAQFVDASRFLIAKDPRDYWRELLAGGVFVDQGGYYVVTRREDVAAALRDYATFSSHRKPLTTPGAGVKSLPIPVPIAYDPPAHSRFPEFCSPTSALTRRMGFCQCRESRRQHSSTLSRPMVGVRRSETSPTRSRSGC